MSRESENYQNEKQNISVMFSNILTEIKDLKKQNEDFRKGTKRDIEELKGEIRGIVRKIEEKCDNLE